LSQRGAGRDEAATTIVGEAAKAIVHGGDIDDVRRRYPRAPEPWIDLSTGINPIPYPFPSVPPQAWSRLPTAADQRALLQSAARRYQVGDPASIVAAPGTQALVQLLPRCVKPCRVAILGPTYEEFALCWRRQGHTVHDVAEFDALARGDVAVVVNPNNPTGKALPRAALSSLSASLASRGGMLLVDEAFIEAGDAAESVAPILAPGTVVLRSFGKIYGLAGVRLGFVVAAAEFAAGLRAELGPWAVSGPAIALGIGALDDDAWLARARQRLARDGARLDAMLQRANCSIVGGTLLFRLAAAPEAASLADRLARHGIHVRRFAYAPSWLRFGLPGSDEAWRRLDAALAADA
jgi:cobalamin biosynthesis protein CobC